MSARKRTAKQGPEITGYPSSGKSNTLGNELLNSYLKLEDLHPLNRYTPDVVSLSDAVDGQMVPGSIGSGKMPTKRIKTTKPKKPDSPK
jgi:hypothetical protein